MIDISIITVGFKSKEFIKGLLESLFQARGDLSIEHFIIDNASDDGTIEMVEKEFVGRSDEKLQIITIQNDKNVGFAKANNIGIRRSKGRYVLLLNPDMRLQKDTLVNMVSWLDTHPNVDLAGCKLISPEGQIVPHIRRFPSVLDQLAILLKIPHIIPSVLNSYLAKDFDYSTEASVDSIRGSFFMIRRSMIEKIGGLDERYFIWFEEVDYCKQIITTGGQIWYTPVTTCVDFVGRSFSLVGGYKKQSYFTESMVKYFAKWHPNSAWIFRALRPFARAAAYIAEKIRL